MGTGRVTMQMVARSAGVSVGTVSKVMNSVGCNPVLEARVRRAISELGYQLDPYARAMRSRRTHCLGLLIERRFSNSVLWLNSLELQLLQVASMQHYQLHIQVMDGQQASEDGFGDFPQRIDGLMLLGTFSPAFLRQVDKSFEMPLVSYGPTIPLARVDMIPREFGTAYTQLFEHLLCLGHRDITCLITGNNSSRDKFKVIEESHRAFSTHCKLHAVRTEAEEDAPRTGYDLTAEALGLYPQTTALVYMADSLALGGTSYLAQQRIRVPQEMSIVSHDDTPWSQQHIPSITSIAYDLHELACELVGRLTCAIEKSTSLPPQVLRLKLIRRESTVQPREI